MRKMLIFAVPGDDRRDAGGVRLPDARRAIPDARAG